MSDPPINDLRARKSEPPIMQMLRSEKTRKALQAVGGKFMNPERVIKLAINSIAKTPKLALCDPLSVLGGLMTSTALGLEANTVAQQAFLIPYKKNRLVKGKWQEVFICEFQIGYRGFITLGRSSGVVRRMAASAIHQKDVFEYLEGNEAFLKFARRLDGDRGELIGAFCYTEIGADRDYAATVLPLLDVFKARARSETFKTLTRAVEDAPNEKDLAKAERALAETPWVAFQDEMAAKTAIRRHYGMLPVYSTDRGTVLHSAAALDEAGEEGLLDLAALANPDAAMDVAHGAEAPTTDHPRVEHEQTIHVDLGQTHIPEIVTNREEPRQDTAKEDPKKEPIREGKPSQSDPRKEPPPTEDDGFGDAA